MTALRRPLAALCLLVALPALAVVERKEAAPDPRIIESAPAPPRSEPVAEASPTKAGQAALEFLDGTGGTWTFRIDPRTDRFTAVRGSGVPLIPGKGNRLDPKAFPQLAKARDEITALDVEPLVRAFVAAQGERLGPATGDLVPNDRSSLAREDGSLISVYYDWMVGGVLVEDATVFARINSGNITQFGSRFVGPIDIDTTPQIKPVRATQVLLAHAGHEQVEFDGDPELLIQTEDGGADRIGYRLIWKVRYTVPGEIETWEGRVDAHTGAVVGFRDANHYTRAHGGIHLVSPFNGAEQRAPLRDLEVFNSSNKITNNGGEYNYIGGLTSSTLSGQWFNINCVGCNAPTQPEVQTLLGSGLIDFGMGGLDQNGNGNSTQSDRSAFFHLNEIRRLALKWIPGLAWLYTPKFMVNTNVAATCNATFSGSAINLYRSGGGCNNTGLVADVVNHEWGHGIDVNSRSGDGGTGEGTGDVNAMHLSHSNLVGPGFGVSGGSVRNLAWQSSGVGLLTKTRIESGDCNTLPGGALSVHCVGQIYGQTAWELANALAAKHGLHTGWRRSERLFFASLPDAGTWNPDDPLNIYEAYLNADDDDGNLANGTPNGAEIYEAFNRHEIATDPAVSSAACARPEQPAPTASTTCDEVRLSWTPVDGAQNYKVFRAELRSNTGYLPMGGTLNSATTTFADTEVVAGVDYYYTVMATTAQGCESTVESPRHAALGNQPYLELVAAMIDDTPAGNSSGFADPGEKIDLNLNLFNHGLATANSVTGTLVSLTSGVTVLDGTASFGNITPNSGLANQDTLRVEVDGSRPCGTQIAFRLDLVEASTCSKHPVYFQFVLGERIGAQWVCADTEICLNPPTFGGVFSATPGDVCAEARLSWTSASSNCNSGTISYNVYRSADPDFVPGLENLLASEFSGTVYVDSLAPPGLESWYIVRALDSVGGEDDNMVARSALAPTAPDPSPPVFAGLLTASSGDLCGETVLDWSAATEGCNTPVLYDVYRSTSSGFTPGATTLVATTFDTRFVDAALPPSVNQTYVVRARDGAGNTDTNLVKKTVKASAVELQVAFETFDPGNAGWALDAANSTATNGNWAHGDPVATSWQPGNDHTSGAGVNCWITGLGNSPSNGDVDGGTTILRSAVYDMTGMLDPSLRYWRWFTNDLGNAPGESTDRLRVEVSNDNGTTWRAVQSVGAGTPLEWVETEVNFGRFVSATSQMRFRFITADLGADSMVEAGIDDLEVYDAAGGCLDCPLPVDEVGTIFVGRAGDDVILNWTGDPATGARFVIYDFNNPGVPLRIGTSDSKVFAHVDALLSGQAFFYRVTAVDDCGNESN